MGTALDKKTHITNTMELHVLRALLDPMLYKFLLHAGLVRAALCTKPNATPLLAFYQWSMLPLKNSPIPRAAFLLTSSVTAPIYFRIKCCEASSSKCWRRHCGNGDTHSLVTSSPRPSGRLGPISQNYLKIGPQKTSKQLYSVDLGLPRHSILASILEAKIRSRGIYRNVET